MSTSSVFKAALAAIPLLGISLPASATFYDIAVTPAGDTIFHWNKSSSYVYTWTTVDDSPNQVFHYYDYDNRSGDYSDATLSFDLTGFGIPAADIISASLNLDILSIWTDSRDDVANISGGGGTVYASAGTGWKAYDVTSSLISSVSSHAATAAYGIGHTGFSGFTFASAEGGTPAFLRIATADAIPEPSTLLLIGMGLAGLFASGAKRQI